MIRMRYQAKRHTKKWIKRKKHAKKSRYREFQLARKAEEHKAAPFVRHIAPENFSFIDNTEEVLSYFSKAKAIFHSQKNVTFDISSVTNLTPDAIALLVASIKSPKFTSTGSSNGNQPERDDLRKLFAESGFNEHVTEAHGFSKAQASNLLHKEVAQKVVESIARNACIRGMKHVYDSSAPEPALYDIHSSLYQILIECMANTHNHAALSRQGECRWWLYVYNNPNTGTTSYTFIDLGVGIFKSAHVESYLKIIGQAFGLYPNIKMVDDLLTGKIHSRIEKDRELRGKGIPQIVGHSKNEWFKSFYIITNDVKINLTNGTSEALNQDFNGTFLHWELVKN